MLQLLFKVWNPWAPLLATTVQSGIRSGKQPLCNAINVWKGHTLRMINNINAD